MIPTLICGDGCAPTPLPISVMGFGGPGPRCAMMSTRGVNKKKVHRLWKEKGLQRRVHSPRKRAGMSSAPEVVTDALKVV
ncbi:hypothetical protein [Mycobacterium sp. Lab-001]|uniref:hypothetical protein n=1 Tax=Mycobacterium sp. Lab-001 TaxID=3410136 RepID=UPI003D185B31